ncbi:MAG: 50S ribosomal protein L9 [Alphaproteobacteria bacterium]|nr:50S ribosomal protein L9 [Alphaproteobacteria bacterium]
MEVILLERVGRLGAMGETVKVKDGYARNFLLPNAKALRATAANKAKFERDRAVLEAKNAATKALAETEAKSIEGKTFVVIRQAGESGQLYGSVSARDIADAATAAGSTVDKNHIHIQKPIKVIGMHDVQVTLHPEVVVAVTVNVARTADEAAAQARGEDLTAVGATEKAEARAAAEAMFAEAQAEAAAEEEGGK